MLKPKSMPFAENRSGPKPKYPFATMKVGQSFVVPAGGVTLSTMMPYACKRGRVLRKKFRVTTLPCGDLQVYRAK